MKTRSALALFLLMAAFCLPMTGAIPVKTAPAVMPPVVVTLTAEKRVAPGDKDAPPTWQPLDQKGTTVLPGDVLRYTVTGSNRLSRPIKGLALTQPIPRGTEYLPHSATASGDARLTISLDGGKTYAETPTIKVTHPDGTTTNEPAPVALYTDLRWAFLGDLPPLTSVSARCEVRIR